MASTRIPYPTENELTPEVRELLSRLPPLNIMRMIAGAPAALRPLSELGEALLLHTALDARLREIAILAVAGASGSGYETAQHQDIGRAIGMPETEIRSAVSGNLDGLDPQARLVWRFAEQIARDVKADQVLTAQVLERLGRQQATELVIVCAYYSALARIIETCGVDLEERLPFSDLNLGGRNAA